VCGAVPEEADLIIEEVCEREGSRMIRADRLVEITPRPGGVVDVRTPERFLPAVRLGLEGAHQRRNAAVAIAIVEELSHGGVQVTDGPLREALTHVRWPGRLERFDAGEAPVLLDAAHNPAGAAALAAYLSEQSWRDATLVFGVMADKDVRGMLRELFRASGLWGAVFCTTAPGERALPAEAVATLVTKVASEEAAVEVIRDPVAALERARQRGRPVVVAGSIFLIGALRDILR
jgi:dihydrofolate synthase/folylpolyglutamate synthase